MPECSVVGVLFESIGKVDIVKSNKITLMQHMSYHWEISGNEFINSDSTTGKIKYMDKALNTWVYNLNLEQRKVLVETIFSIINTAEIKNISEIAPYLIKRRDVVKQKIKSVDKETSVCVKEIIRGLVKISFKSVFASDDDIITGVQTLED